MPLTADEILVSAGVQGAGVTDQAAQIEAALATAYAAAQDLEGKRNATSNASGLVETAMRGHDTWVEIVLRNVDSLALEDATQVIVQPLLVPMTINLQSTA